MANVVIAGSGQVGRALQLRLQPTHDVRLAQGDLMAVHEAEVALAGAQTVVFLARSSARIARLPRASSEDVDLLLADSVARAAARCGVKKLVFFACGPDDARRALLAHSGLPLSTLVGGGPDPVTALVELVERAEPTDLTTAAWSGPEREPGEPRYGTCSIQRYPRLPGTALELARRYFEWLPGAMSLVKTSSHETVFTLRIAGVRALVLRHVSGRSDDEVAWFDVADGHMVRRTAAGRLEFRHLLDGKTSMTSLVGYQPSLPFWVYRLTQAAMHERVMRRFGAYLRGEAA